MSKDVFGNEDWSGAGLLSGVQVGPLSIVTCPRPPTEARTHFAAMDAVTIGGIVGNVVSVVGVVIVNKWVQQKHGFDFMVFLSFMHFGVTTVGMRALLHAGLFRYKEASFSGVYKIALGSLGSVGFMNLNLAHNTVGMYQLSKLACIPVTLLLQQTVMGGERAPLAVKLTLVPLMLGMGIATVYDVNVNFVGTVFATVAVLCTVVAQILTSSTQARDARATRPRTRAARRIAYRASAVSHRARLFFPLPALAVARVGASRSASSAATRCSCSTTRARSSRSACSCSASCSTTGAACSSTSGTFRSSATCSSRAGSRSA